MIQDRRQFLKMSSTLAASVALGGTLNDAMASSKLKQFGIQLYTLRDEIEKDPKRVLAQLAEMGYKQIESYEGKQGMFWGMTNTEYASYLKSLGLTAISTHCDISKNLSQKAEEAAAIGMKYLICPWIGPKKSLKEFSWVAKMFNEYGKICKQAGIRFAYHNHGYSFQKLDGHFPQDILMEETEAGLVDFEMDIYWVVDAGEDPMAWLAKYPKRFRLCHVKDRAAGAEGKHVSTILGNGDIDYNTILASAKSYGMQYYIAEQEHYEGTTPLDAAKENAAYLKKLKIG